MFDFSWTTVTRGDKPYMNYKGLVTHDRQTKKDAFYFYKANWSEEPVLHIVSRRDSIRNDSLVQISIYTNLTKAELVVNGVPVSKKQINSELHKITWENVTLKKGLNHISVTGEKGDRKLADYCEWKYE